MTNLLATVTASIFSVVVTNWSVVGNLSLMSESKSFMVQQGAISTNTYVVFPYRGSNAWQLISIEPGPKLKEHRLIERLEFTPANRPPALPMNPVQITNVGTVILESK